MRLRGGRRLFVSYQWGKPHLDEIENAAAATVPRRQVTQETSPEARSGRDHPALALHSLLSPELLS
ncbi:MAG: hypothetical protein B5M55_03305 [Desulfococcus sp. 4484_242]|nr:MAG: hypothetical protein B5M55_03305 [Desulfococcus sp. 4484_242]